MKKKASRGFALVSYIILFRNWPVALRVYLYIKARSISANTIEDVSSIYIWVQRFWPILTKWSLPDRNANVVLRHIYKIRFSFLPHLALKIVKSANVNQFFESGEKNAKTSSQKSKNPKAFALSNTIQKPNFSVSFSFSFFAWGFSIFFNIKITISINSAFFLCL